MNKAYDPTIWYNAPSTNSPINDVNLNKISQGLNTVDNRVIDLDVAKANQQDLLRAVQSVVLNESTGVITITKMDGTSSTYDTLLEKVAVNFDYDETTQQLTITLQDGSTKTVDLSSLISQTEFTDSSEIAFHVNSTTGAVYADIVNGSIGGNKLQPDYLADVTAQAALATTSAQSANSSANDAHYDAQLAESYAVGTSGVRQGEETDNAKYYKEQAESAVSNIDQSVADAASSAQSAASSATMASGYADTASDAADTATGAVASIGDSVTQAQTAATTATEAATTATNSATTATTNANTSRTNADLARSYAVGGTGTRSGEDTDNARYYKEQAAAIVGDKGHVILDADGTQYTGRTNLRFRNARVSDDSVADTTNVFVGITDTEWTQIQAILA